MTQCIHKFALDKSAGQVKCILCGDLDDEMQLFNKGEEVKEEKNEADDFYASQVTFE